MHKKAVSEKSLWIGPGTELILQIHGLEGRFKSSTVGIEAGEYLIVHNPKVAGIESKIFVGNQITVLVVHSGTVYAFHSTILNYVKNPARLLFLSYPQKMERQELRVNQRMECCIPAIARPSRHRVEYRGVIVDISAGGCKFTTSGLSEFISHPIQVGDKINLVCELLGIGGIKSLPGELRNIKQDGKRISLGIQFDDASPELSKKIDTYVNTVTELLEGSSD